MSIWLYSEMAFPGTHEDGRKHDYLQAYGHQIILKAREWTKLPSMFERPRWFDSRQRGALKTNDAVAEATIDVSSAEKVAEFIVGRWGYLGIVSTDFDPSDRPKEIALLEKRAELANLDYRGKVVTEFEEARKAKLLGHNDGRLHPTPFETDCYAKLGIAPPSSLDDIKLTRGAEAGIAKAIGEGFKAIVDATRVPATP